MEIIQTSLLVIILAILLYSTTKNSIKKKPSGRLVLVDSSVLIDGRITDVVETGFLGARLVVPSSVLREMQYLADNADSEKRSRARHGLDVVKQLQESTVIDTEIYDDGIPGDGGVDERLVELSKKLSADLLTLDFNLNKVAVAEGIQVLNINQLAQSVRMSYLPGEKRYITLVDKGQDKTQAVGYLEDGTMVVVENASKQIGQSVEVEFTRALQTAAGKMLFAKKTTSQQVAHKTKPSTKKTYTKRRRTAEDKLVDLANK